MSAGSPADSPFAATLLQGVAQLEARFGARLLERAEYRGELTFSVAPVDWVEVLRACKETARARFRPAGLPAG